MSTRNVGRIGHHQAHPLIGHTTQEVHLAEDHAFSQSECLPVALCDGQRFTTYVQRQYSYPRFLSKAEGDCTAPGTHIHNHGLRHVTGEIGPLQQVKNGLHQLFRLRSRDQHCRRDFHVQIAKSYVPQYVGDGLTLGATRNQLSVAVQLISWERSVVLSVELNPLYSQGVSEQQFSIQARTLAPFVLEVVGRHVQQASDSPAGHVSPSPSLVRRSRLPAAQLYPAPEAPL